MPTPPNPAQPLPPCVAMDDDASRCRHCGQQMGDLPPRGGGMHPFQNAEGRWQCQFCLNYVASRDYLIRHTRRDHEGHAECRGTPMASYLNGMSRWLCGTCMRSHPQSKTRCDDCQCGREDCEVSGDDPGAVRIVAIDVAPPPDVRMEAPPFQLPISDIFAFNVLLLEHVPVKCLILWATILGHLLDIVASLNDYTSWAQLRMVTKCCLWA